MKTLRERFDEKWVPEPTSGCWLWTASLKPVGYGQFAVGGRKDTRRERLAHRVSWELHNGPVPDGLWVLHKCDTRACVNPDHLFLGTHADNMADKIAKGRKNGGGANKGSANNLAKLTEPKVRAIKTLLKHGWEGRKLARSYGVTDACISDIKVGKSWNHVQ